MCLFSELSLSRNGQLIITGMGLDNYSRKEKHWAHGPGRSRNKVETEKSNQRIFLTLWSLPSTSWSSFCTSFCVLLWWNDSQDALWLVKLVKLLNSRRQKEKDGTKGLKMKVSPWLPKQGRIWIPKTLPMKCLIIPGKIQGLWKGWCVNIWKEKQRFPGPSMDPLIRNPVKTNSTQEFENKKKINSKTPKCSFILDGTKQIRAMLQTLYL